MSQNPITKEEVRKEFFVTSKYTVSGGWPRETVAACKIICTDGLNHEWVSHQVYRNETRDKHAEVKIIHYLKKNPIVKSSGKVTIQVYINYSPCSECAKSILKCIEKIEEEERKVVMTITFANFYNTHAYQGNSQENAKANIAGLIALNAHPQVELRLFGVHVGWERFLGMSEFFNLTEDEKNECLDKAESPERKTREIQDMLVWNDIFGVEEITSKLDRSNISKLRDEVETQIENREATGEGVEPKSLDEIFEDVIGKFARLSTTAV